MKRIWAGIQATVAAAIIAAGLAVLIGCAGPPHEGLAIYLTKGDIPPSQMAASGRVEIAEQPIIAMQDILSYNADTHEITLADAAFERVANLQVPVRGKSFVLTVDRKTIYRGAFWTPISSLSFDGITIWKPFQTDGPKVIQIGLGYPGKTFFAGEDPRNNQEVLDTMEKAGKLHRPAATDKLPHSMKGYELYSWSQDSQWHFSLITGTNRNKSAAEIVDQADIVSETGWVQVKAVGIEALKSVLSRIPQNEFVFWLTSPRADETPPSGVKFALPATPVVDEIKEFAANSGLQFGVADQ